MESRETSAKYRLPYAGNSIAAICLMMVVKMVWIQAICCSADISGHLWRNCTPEACSVMMYSQPIGFEATSLHSRILGIGTDVLDCTDMLLTVQRLRSSWNGYLHSRYLMVATSELVVSLCGPATTVGSLATIRLALSHVKMKLLLKPPSFFS